MRATNPARLARPPPRPAVRARAAPLTDGAAADAAYGWTPAGTPPAPTLRSPKGGGRLVDLPVAAIRRPLAKARPNDGAKVAALAASIREYGLREPIDVLECPDGVWWGFSGCHRFEAHQVLGAETIACRVRRVSPATLRMHLALGVGGKV